MAGIKNAMRQVIDHRDVGTCIALGETSFGSKFMIVNLRHDEGYHLVMDYGSDVSIDERIKVDTVVRLLVTSNWTAKWVRDEDVSMEQLKE